LLWTLEELLGLDAAELRSAMQKAVQRVSDALGADKADVFVHDPESEALVAVATSATPMGRRQRELGLDCLPLASGGRVAWVYQHGLAYLVGRAADDVVELPAVAERLGVQSSILAPMELAGELRGVLIASSTRAEAFGEDALRFLVAVAHWIGLVGRHAPMVDWLAPRAVDAGSWTTAASWGGALTPRQREVAALIAAGRSNREIAERLVLVPGTVANHVEHILDRLGFRSRAQIAVWAAERGLHRAVEPPKDA
jgi:DNA-binding CsgD family transcriptional regulator